MDSKQLDNLAMGQEWADGFGQAYGQDYVGKTAEVQTFMVLLTTWVLSNPIPDTAVVPPGWNPAAEQEYQQELANLTARLASAIAAGNQEQEGSVRNTLTMMSDPETGRAYYLKAKGNGWL